MSQPPFDPNDLPQIEEVAVPETLPILALPDAVIFPSAVLALSISGDGWVKAIDDAALSSRVVGVFWDTAGDAGAGDPRTLARTGCAAQIARLSRQPGGGVQVLLQGLARIRLQQLQVAGDYPQARIAVLPEPERSSPEADSIARTVRVAFEQVVRLSPNLPDQAAVAAANIPAPGLLADLIAANLGLTVNDQQTILDTTDVAERLRAVLGFLERERELLDIANRTREDVAKSQREYVLRQQMETIRRELGEGDEQGAEVAELRRRLDDAGLPPEPRREAERELARLARMNPAAPDFGITRTYLEWLVGLPWSASTPDNLDLDRARQVLDEDHYDLEKIKDRIVEYLAVRKLHADQEARAPAGRRAHSPILCFVGPPGVGKTSLGQSVARALERKFVRVALGGVRDEADIRGFRRTYIGAIPGRILQGLNRGGSNNPVMLLDEVDKISAGIQGDPAAALLELLDPAQNHTFVDRYLDVPFDMSRVLFICTANQLETIPGPLLDRMEIMHLAGYTELEKLQIARRYLIPRQIEANGLAPLGDQRGADQARPESEGAEGADAEGAGAPVAADDLPASNLPPEDVAERSLAPALTDATLHRLIREYTMEAGVRDLERRIGAIFRKMATRLASGKELPAQVDGPDLDDLIGPPRFRSERILGDDEVGVVTGLAWTPAGGDVLMVEASAVPGSGQLILTGHLGDVMRESARAAVTYARSRDGDLGIPAELFQKRDIHIHVPAGAVPKDGPSAGITMASAIISALTGRPAEKHVAMTGEITLRGKVLPIGGLKEKLLAAQRAGVRTVLIPRDNEIDLRDVPAETRDQLEIIPVEHMDEVVPRVLLQPAEQAA